MNFPLRAVIILGCCNVIVNALYFGRSSDYNDNIDSYDEYGDNEEFQQNHDTQDIVGSNLFWDFKKCFSPEDVALLTLRMAFEGLVPSKNITKLESDKTVEVFLDYVAGTMKIIQRFSRKETVAVIQISYFDAIGGYLHYKLLPIAKLSFYAGTVSNTNVQNLIELYQYCRSIVNTNGNNWKRPVKMPSSIQAEIEPLKILPDNHKLTKELEETTPCLNILSNDHSGSIVPMPRILDARSLQSVYFPFRHQQIFDMRAESSAFIFLRYYVSAIKCYCFQKIPQDEFEQEFSYWTAKYLVPYLNDDNFYPGLGGIWRIIASLTQSSSDKNQFDWNGHYPMPHIKTIKPDGFAEDILKSIDAPETKKTSTAMKFVKDNNTYFLGMAIILAILLMFGIVCLIIKFYRLHKLRKHEYQHGRTERPYHGGKAMKDDKKTNHDDGFNKASSSSILSGSCEKIKSKNLFREEHNQQHIAGKEKEKEHRYKNNNIHESSSGTPRSCFPHFKKRKDKTVLSKKAPKMKQQPNEKTRLKDVSEESNTSSSETVVLNVDRMLDEARKDLNEHYPKGRPAAILISEI